MTGYRFKRKYLFLGGGARPDLWLEVGHDQKAPPEEMVCAVETVFGDPDNEFVRRDIPAERHRYFRHQVGLRQRGQEPQERWVYVHESVVGAKEREPLSSTLTRLVWDEIMREEAKK